MEEWYYDEAGQQRGPVSLVTIKGLLDSRTIQSNTLVWNKSMTGWTPADRVDGLQISPYTAPAADMGGGVDWSGYTPTGPQTRPWVRYWARTADVLLFAISLGVVFALVLPMLLDLNEGLLGVIILVAVIFVEPVLLCVVGTTPFKALLNVRVRKNDGNKLSYFQALKRMFGVLIQGQGLGIPLISLITHITAHGRLTRTGTTRWDESGGFVVTHRKIEWWRWLILIAFLGGFVALLLLGEE